MISERTFGTFSVLFGARFVLHGHAVLLSGRVRFWHGRTRVKQRSSLLYPPTRADARGSASRITGFCLCTNSNNDNNNTTTNNNNNKKKKERAHTKKSGVSHFCKRREAAAAPPPAAATAARTVSFSLYPPTPAEARRTALMQKLLFYSFRRDVWHFFAVVWHPFCPSLPFRSSVREGKFFPWQRELEAVAETHAQASFLQFQTGRLALFRCCLAPVLSFTAIPFFCSGG